MPSVYHIDNMPVANWQQYPDFVFVGEGSPWCNPALYDNLSWDIDGEIAQALLDYWERWYSYHMHYRISELRGKHLVIDYAGERTHAHILLAKANEGITDDTTITQKSRGQLFALINPYALGADGKPNRDKRLYVTSRLMGQADPDWHKSLASFNELTDNDWYTLRDWAYPNRLDGDYHVGTPFDVAARKLGIEWDEK